MTQDDIIKMAREAGFNPVTFMGAGFELFERFAALVAEAEREALAQPEQKPVAVVVAAEYEDGSHAGHHLEWRGRNEANDYPEGTEFYTSPPQRKPLTDEAMRALWDSHGYKSALCMRFARAIERAHGIGEKL